MTPIALLDTSGVDGEQIYYWYFYFYAKYFSKWGNTIFKYFSRHHYYFDRY